MRGPGLFVGSTTCSTATARPRRPPRAPRAWGWAVDHGLLCQFGGIDGNVPVWPPLTTPDDDFERMLDLVADVTAFIQQTVHGRATVGA